MKTMLIATMTSLAALACASFATGGMAAGAGVPASVDRPAVRRPLLPPNVRAADLKAEVRFDNVVYGDGCLDPEAPVPNTLSFELHDAGRADNPFLPQPNVGRVHTIEAFQVDRAGEARSIFQASRERSTPASAAGPWPFSSTFRHARVSARRSGTVHFTLLARDRNGTVLGHTQFPAPATPPPSTVLRAASRGARWRSVELTGESSLGRYWELEVDARNIARHGTVHPDSVASWGASRRVHLLSPDGESHRFDIHSAVARMRVLVTRRHDDVPGLLDRSLTVSFPRLSTSPCARMIGPDVQVSLRAPTPARTRDAGPRPDPRPMPFAGNITGIDCGCRFPDRSTRIVPIRACVDPSDSPFQRNAGAGFSCGLLAGALSHEHGDTDCVLSAFNGRDGGACSWDATYYERE